MNYLSGLKVALIHFWHIRRGGAERVFEVVADMFPQADIFMLLLDPQTLAPALARRRIHTSFLQRWPGTRRCHRFLLPFFPLALESFDLTGYDLVISSEAGPAKGVITGANTCHICYCHSPMRYLWEMGPQYRMTMPGGMFGRAAFDLCSHYVRNWDYASAARVDHFVANCGNVAGRIRKHYRRDATIIYPPVDLAPYQAGASLLPEPSEDFYLVVSRLVAYKRIDLAITACNRLGRRLVIIGGGEERRRLERLAGPTVQFLGEVDDATIRNHYRRCRALLFPGEEDFGLTPIEAQASGRPVIAFGRGGALETIRPLLDGAQAKGATGVFFAEATAEALAAAIQVCETREEEWSPERIRANVLAFDHHHFRHRFGTFVAEKLGVRGAAAAAGTGSPTFFGSDTEPA